MERNYMNFRDTMHPNQSSSVSRKQQSNQGFTLIELMVAAAIGMVTILVAGRVMVDQLEATRRIETTERQRSDWIRVNRFITNEINLAAEISETLAINEGLNCSIGNGTAKMVIRFPRHLQLDPAIYYTTKSQPGWVDVVLKRCGPSLSETGDYSNTLSDNVILDGLKQTTTSGVVTSDGFDVTVTGTRMVDFSISLTGKLNKAYQQEEGARARVRDVFLRPSETSICLYDARADGFGTKETLTAQSDNFLPGYPDWDAITDGNVLICGNGGNDTLQGKDGDDIIEASNPGKSKLIGGSGNDRLLGGDDSDELDGNEGNDILIAKRGDDILKGGDGTNHYVPGIDDEESRCDRDIVYGNAKNQNYDVIYFSKSINQYTFSNQCDNEICRVQRGGNTKVVDIYGGELLVFDDQLLELNPYSL